MEFQRSGFAVRQSVLRLSSFVAVGSDGETAIPVPTLGYTKPRFASDGQVTAMTTPPGRSPAEGDVALADLDGDSPPDLLVAQIGQHRTYLNQDGVAWKAAENWLPSNSPSLSLSSIGVQLADVDGDGAIDPLAKSGIDFLRYFPGHAAMCFAQSLLMPTVASFTFEEPEVRLADMDGDRRVDAVISTAAGVAIGYNNNGVDWHEPVVVGAVDDAQPLRFSDGKTQPCDVNWDCVQDLCYLRSGSLAYWLGRGSGRFESARKVTGVPLFEPSDPWKLVDLDGDGWTDLVHIGVTQVSYSFATQAGAFGLVQTITGTPTKTSDTRVEIADINGPM